MGAHPDPRGLAIAVGILVDGAVVVVENVVAHLAREKEARRREV